MAGVLGVPTVEYFPYAFFNLINPLLALVFAFTGYGVEHLDPASEVDESGPEERRAG